MGGGQKNENGEILGSGGLAADYLAEPLTNCADSRVGNSPTGGGGDALCRKYTKTYL